MKTFSFKVDPLTGEEYYEIYLRGRHLLDDSLLTKMSCFTGEERLTLGVEGYVRAGVSTIEEQAQRCMEAYDRKSDDLERYIYLLSLLDRCEVLFYYVLTRNLTEMVPIVYTPTVGQACLQMSHIARRFRGIYITAENIRNIDRILRSVSRPVINLIVATDGERILGLGDLGSDGMGIPVGKINLYVAGGGLHPTCCLPISLDVGTNNETLLKDPLYLGIRKPRLEGQAYFDFIERFVLGVRRNFPGALLQWEDFAKLKAFPLLRHYRDRIPSFNDDIQGTGATALAALLTTARITRRKLREHRFLIVGMGQAGVGIANCLRTALLAEGLEPGEVRHRLFPADRDGLLIDGMPGIEEPQRPFLQPREAVASWRLRDPNVVDQMDVIRNAKITALIGVSANPGLFDSEILGAMSANTENPVVFALSNPTSRSECTFEEALAGTSGRVLFASGSPFAPVDFGGRRREASQCNNMFVFPGVGLGALVATSPQVTEDMFTAASKVLSEMVTPEQMTRGLLLPELSDVREASARVALAVAIEARDAGHGRRLSDDQLNELVRKAQWIPHYAPYRPGRAPNTVPRLP